MFDKTTEQKLDDLAALRDRMADIEANKQKMIDDVLTPTIKAEIDDIEAEFAPLAVELASKSAKIEKEIKAEAIKAGETIRGNFLMACYEKPGISVDKKMIVGMAEMVPEIKKALTPTEASISIRKVK